MRAFIPLVAAFGIVFAPPALAPVWSGKALAQNDQAGEPEQVKQIALTEPQIQGFIAAEKEIDPILEKLPEGTETPDAKTMAQLDAIAKKHNFANFEEYNVVAANIGLVMAGFDPQTKKYVGPETMIKKQIAEIQATKGMPAAEKKQALDQLNAALKSVVPVQFPENIKLVTKYYDRLAAAMPQEG